VRNYEALFLVEPTLATREWSKVTDEIDRIVKRNGANVIQVTKWGERKLAYPVKRNNRGTFVLAYFASPEKAVAKIRADFVLSEIVLRSIVTRHEGDFRKEPPKDFETAGTLPPRRTDMGDGGVPHEARGPRF